MKKYSFISEIWDPASSRIKFRRIGNDPINHLKRSPGSIAAGAGAGALVGSALGPVGTVAGGIVGGGIGAAVNTARTVGSFAKNVFSSKRQLIDKEIRDSEKILRSPRFLGKYSERDRALAQARLDQARRLNQNLSNYRQAIYAAQNPEQRRAINRRYRNQSGNISAMYSADKQYGY